MLDYLAFNWYYWFFIGAACALALQLHATPEPLPGATDLDRNFFKSNRSHAPSRS
jgi:hypothetical protein